MLNQAQRNHISSRVKELLAGLDRALRIKHTKPGTKLTDEEKFKLIVQGKVKLKPTITASEYGGRFVDKFDFSKLVKPDFVDEVKLKKERDDIKTQSNKLLDEAILGTGELAHKMLQEFENVIKKL